MIKEWGDKLNFKRLNKMRFLFFSLGTVSRDVIYLWFLLMQNRLWTGEDDQIFVILQEERSGKIYFSRSFGDS